MDNENVKSVNTAISCLGQIDVIADLVRALYEVAIENTDPRDKDRGKWADTVNLYINLLRHTNQAVDRISGDLFEDSKEPPLNRWKPNFKTWLFHQGTWLLNHRDLLEGTDDLPPKIAWLYVENLLLPPKFFDHAGAKKAIADLRVFREAYIEKQKAKRKTRKRPGQRSADYKTRNEEYEILKACKRARDTGVCKADFARQIGKTVKTLDRILDRVRKRIERSDKSFRQP